MGQWHKERQGLLLPKEQMKPAAGPEVKAAEKLRELAQVTNGGVEVHPDIINGVPGLRIKVPFE